MLWLVAHVVIISRPFSSASARFRATKACCNLLDAAWWYSRHHLLQKVIRLVQFPRSCRVMQSSTSMDAALATFRDNMLSWASISLRISGLFHWKVLQPDGGFLLLNWTYLVFYQFQRAVLVLRFWLVAAGSVKPRTILAETPSKILLINPTGPRTCRYSVVSFNSIISRCDHTTWLIYHVDHGWLIQMYAHIVETRSCLSGAVASIEDKSASPQTPVELFNEAMREFLYFSLDLGSLTLFQRCRCKPGPSYFES